MKDWQRRTLVATAVSVVVVLAYALVYRAGMAAYEGRTISMIQSMQVVVEAITTSGFGGHAPWRSDRMNVLVLVMNLTGVVMVFMALPLFVFPLLRSAFTPTVPASLDRAGHVILCPFTPRVDATIQDLKAGGREYVLIEPDPERAASLHARGYATIEGDPEMAEVLRRASLASAVAVVVDAADDVSTSIVLAVRELDERIRVVTILDDETLEPYHWLAGATQVLSPRKLIGESLARQTPYLLPEIQDVGREIGYNLELAEVIVAEGSTFHDLTVAEAGLRERYGVEIIGAWVEGTFQSPIRPELRLGTRVRLLVAGTPSDVDEFLRQASDSTRPLGDRKVVLVGYGRSGKAAARALAGTNARLTIVDAREQEGVDVVGDARDPEVYRAAGVEDAVATLIDLDDDTSATFATLIIRKASPDSYIIAGANAQANVRKLYRAGADYVESLAAVTARLISATIYADEKVLAVEGRIVVVRVGAGTLAGRTLRDARVRTETGCTVLSVVRDGLATRSPDPRGFVFDDSDSVIIAGTDAAVRRYEETFIR
jgi:Trk K+ transport system NAD-binding subunit